MASQPFTYGVDGHNPGASDENMNEAVDKRKRSSRACDQCRRLKNKCVSTAEAEACAICLATNTECTYNGPTFKRGPPRGYIQALELRLKQVEAVLGTIAGSRDARAQGIIHDLKQDRLAQDILDRVDDGPFGATGRASRGPDADYATFMSEMPPHSSNIRSKHSGRANRDARTTRERISSVHEEDEIPTTQWQEKLTILLANSASQHPFQSHNFVSGSSASYVPNLNLLPSDLYTIDDGSENEFGDRNPWRNPEATGELSLDENEEILYHGETSGLSFLERASTRTDQLDFRGIWRLPTALSSFSLSGSEALDEEDKLPSLYHQDALINLYFTHVHPMLPFIRESSFLHDYYTRRNSPSSSPALSSQSKLLLLAIFAIASRYIRVVGPIFEQRGMSEAEDRFSKSARRLLPSIFNRPSLTTCQALILMAYHSIGIGSPEQGWMYIGMATRMGESLGLHRSASKWRRFGTHVFSNEQQEDRNCAWWACMIVERLISASIGRPVSVLISDCDTDLPQISSAEDGVGIAMHISQHNSIMACFREAASLSRILGCIQEKVYTAQPEISENEEKRLMKLQDWLDQWRSTLPEPLQYDVSSKRPVPPSYVLDLHMQYWYLVLLLQRRFIPNQSSSDAISEVSPAAPAHQRTPSPKAIDHCKNAADYITAIAADLRSTYGLEASSPFLPSYLMNAGIMHIASLSKDPTSRTVKAGMEQNLTCLKELELIWPSAVMCTRLLGGATSKLESEPSLPGSPNLKKRYASEAFGANAVDKASEARYGRDSHIVAPSPTNVHHNNEQAKFAEMLDLKIPNVTIPVDAMPASAAYGAAAIVNGNDDRSYRAFPRSSTARGAESSEQLRLPPLANRAFPMPAHKEDGASLSVTAMSLEDYGFTQYSPTPEFRLSTASMRFERK